MILTLFHRATDAVYDEYCDQASLLVLDVASQPAGYVGTVWEAHEASDALNQQVCDDSEIDAVLASWGLHLAPPPVDVAADTTVQDVATDPVAPDPVATDPVAPLAGAEKEGWVDYID